MPPDEEQHEEEEEEEDEEEPEDDGDLVIVAGTSKEKPADKREQTARELRALKRSGRGGRPLFLKKIKDVSAPPGMYTVDEYDPNDYEDNAKQLGGEAFQRLDTVDSSESSGTSYKPDGSSSDTPASSSTGSGSAASSKSSDPGRAFLDIQDPEVTSSTYVLVLSY